MRDLLTPKQVARALDVSESSVKRWCDKGAIPTQYTAGGHRRIPLAPLLQLVREGSYQLIHPEALGLPATSGQTGRVVNRAREQLIGASLFIKGFTTIEPKLCWMVMSRDAASSPSTCTWPSTVSA